ncbi:MAG: hypothetical protein K8S23_12935 [Candidatus Cloacimonetes bacterium]|nr:hypothetical protein [Candidatus Cloacimonadota bacterium]
MNKFIFIIVCIVLSSVLCYSVERINVSVVFPSDIEAYKQAWNGYKEFFDDEETALWFSQYNLKEEESNLIYSKINKEKPDIIITFGTKTAKLAKEKITNIPVVFCMVFNALKLSGSNMTGVSMEIPVKIKLKKIKQILPQAKRIGLIYSDDTISRYEEIAKVCNQNELIVIGEKISSEKELPKAIKNIFPKIDCFLMIPDSKIYFPMSVKHLLLQSLRNKIPVVGLSSKYTKAGALFSLDCDYYDLGRQSAIITMRIINGEKPSDIEPLNPRKTKLSLNKFAVERLKIKIPFQILEETWEVFGE